MGTKEQLSGDLSTRPTDHSLHLQDNPTKSEARMRLVLLRPMISAHKTMFTVVAINGFKCAKCNSNMLKGRWRRGNKRVVSISAKLHLHSPSLESNQFQFLPSPLQTVTLQRSIQIRHFDYTMKGASTCWHEPHAVPGACRIDKNRFHYLHVPALIIFYAHGCHLSTFCIVKMQTGSGGQCRSLILKSCTFPHTVHN